MVQLGLAKECMLVCLSPALSSAYSSAYSKHPATPCCSGGFAFIHPDSSADICAVEAVDLGDLDADAGEGWVE